MAYEIFARRLRRIGSPTVCFAKAGRITFNKAAVKILQEQAVEFVLALWDPGAQKVGIRPITKKDPRAYTLRYNPAGTGAQFSAVTFMEHIGIDYQKETKTFPAEWNAEQGLFEINIGEKATEEEKQPTLLAVSGLGKRQTR